MAEQLSADQRQALITAVLAAASAGDAEAQVANYTDDVEVVFPFAEPPSAMRGIAEVRAGLTAAFQVFRFSLTPDRWHDTPLATIVEFHGDGTYLPTGAPYANRYIAVFEFRDGRICRQTEYYNPLAAQRAMA